MSRTGWWIVAYDITAPRRLARVHRFLKKHGLPTQYSVFTVEVDGAGLNRILAEVGRLIDARTDDVRVYPIAAKCPVLSLGQPTLPRGLIAVPTPRRTAA